MSAISDLIDEKISKLPQISQAPLQIIVSLWKEDYSIEDIANILETDINLTTQCLRIVNSAYSGLSKKIFSIRHAASFLGAKTILTLAVKEGFNANVQYRSEAADKAMQEYWDHSLKAAAAAKILTFKYWKNMKQDIAYTAGLLHDLGKIVFIHNTEDTDFDLSVLFSNNCRDAEKEYFGIDHTLIGEKLAEIWRFPEKLKNVVRYHHHPEDAPENNRHLIYIAHVADILVQDEKQDSDDIIERLPLPIRNKIFSSEENISKLKFEIEVDYLTIKKQLNFSSEDSND